MRFDMLKDGDQTIICIHGPSVAVDELVFRILNAAMLEPEEARKEAEKYPEPAESVELPKIEGLKPVAEPVPAVPNAEERAAMQPYAEFRLLNKLTVGEAPYAEMTPFAILRKDHEAGLVWLRNYVKSHKDDILPQLKVEITKTCKRFMRELPDNLGYLDSRTRKLSFIKTLCTEYGISANDGYKDFREFTQFSSDQEVTQKVISVAEFISQIPTKIT